MEVTSGAEEGFVREWTPCSHILNLIPPRIQTGLFSNELCLTCVDAVSEYIALGTNVGLVYWYDRKKGNIQRLRCEASTSPITYVKIVSTVDYMVGAGNAAGQVTVFQIPKEHPENLPDTFKPKVEPKVERYTIGDLHKSKITAIEWSKNGMRLFSGDKNGVIIMTEIDFYMHLCKSMEIVNEEHEIVQMSYYQNTLLVSSVYRSIVCERRDNRWHVTQLGKKERKSLCALGAVLQHSYASGGAAAAYCARPGLRVWRADPAGRVQQTLLFKEAISNPLTVAELLNPSQRKHSHAEREYNFGPLFVFREHFLVSHNEHVLYILDPRSLTAVAVVDDLRRILSVSVSRDEIFVLEGERSLLRLAHAPEPAALAADEPANLMTKSLTSSLQHAVNTVRDLTHLDQTVPYISSVLEQPISMFTRNETLDAGLVASGEECFELPPIKHLPLDISDNVLESIINEFKDVSSDAEEIRRVKSEELQKKLKLYNSIMEKKYDEELIHSSRRSRRKESGSGPNTPRVATPVRKPDCVSYTSPCVMNISVYGNIPQQNDDLLEQQIEEKEKILAKMLNLESLSIKSPAVKELKNDVIASPKKQDFDKPVQPPREFTTQPEKRITEKAVSKTEPAQKKIEPGDLVPKVVKMPNNWNLENIQLKLDIKNGVKDATSLISPDDHLDSEWEVI
ncbi:WD repeat-containing protein CG11141 [Nymphalis io]|uniref:WD repeat-containing protein CG11141 n=1 Tax=Inachis io TaxID=171585 RepID=UPI0021687581|nr:WD repeat-containing protein CG11141 [Nymphalis io]